MGRRTAFLALMAACAWMCICAAPCTGQAPDQARGAAGEPRPDVPGMPDMMFAAPPDPFADVMFQDVAVHLDGGTVLKGLLVRNVFGFLVLEQQQPHKTLVVNAQKVVYVETAG